MSTGPGLFKGEQKRQIQSYHLKFDLTSVFLHQEKVQWHILHFTQENEQMFFFSGYTENLSVSKQSSISVWLFFFLFKIKNVGNILFKEKVLVEKPPHAFKCLQALRQEGSTWAGLVADASQTCLSPAALGLWFQQCRASPCSLCQPSTEYLTGSAPDLLQLPQFPKFKKEIQNIPSPPSTKSSVLLKGEGPGWTESCSDLTQLFRVKKEKIKKWPIGHS